MWWLTVLKFTVTKAGWIGPIVSFFRGRKLMIIGVVIAALMVVYLYWRIGGLKSEVHDLEVELSVAREANGSNQETISRLQSQIQTMVATRAADREAAVREVAERQAEVAALQQSLEDARDEREIIYLEDPRAADWAADPVPDAIVRRLRF